MSQYEKNLVDYIVVCISEFAKQYNMKMQDVFSYLHEHKGIEFLKEFYDVEHTLSFEDVLDDLTAICRKNGGTI